MKLIAIITALLVAGAAAYFPLKGLWGDGALITTCEEAIRDRLKAPATYQRIAVSTSVEEVTPEQAAGEIIEPKSAPANIELHQAELEMYRRGAFMHQAVFEYDAENAMGVPLRLFTTCTYYTTKQEPPERILSPLLVSLD